MPERREELNNKDRESLYSSLYINLKFASKIEENLGDNNYLKSIKELRELAGLKQNEFAIIVELTQAYLSEVEHGKKQLTITAAKKIASGFNSLVNTQEDREKYDIDFITLFAGHFAKMHGGDNQFALFALLIEIGRKQRVTDHLLKTKLDTDAYDPEVTAIVEAEVTPIERIIKKQRNVIENNKVELLRRKDSGEESITNIKF